MAKLIVKDWHTSIGKILQCLEKCLQPLRKSLHRRGVNYLLQRLDDLNLLITRLGITLHGV